MYVSVRDRLTNLMNDWKDIRSAATETHPGFFGSAAEMRILFSDCIGVNLIDAQQRHPDVIDEESL